MKKILAIILVLFPFVKASSEQAWILCRPDSYVICRNRADRKSDLLGYFYCGDDVETTGKTKNGYMKLTGLPLESTTGWVHTGYLVYDPPKAINKNARVTANKVQARRMVNGKRRQWLNEGAKVFVYSMSCEWAVTNVGYVKTEFLEVMP